MKGVRGNIRVLGEKHGRELWERERLWRNSWCEVKWGMRVLMNDKGLLVMWKWEK